MGITLGVSDDMFDPTRRVTNQEFTTFLLRSLGYSEDENDFTFARALDKALEIGLYSPEVLAQLNDGAFLRGDAVVAMVSVLMTNIKGSNNTLLIDTLVAANTITREAADLFIISIARIDNVLAQAEVV